MADPEAAIEQLTGMGFSAEQCALALGVARGSVEGALQILLNPEILELITAAGLAGGGPGRGRGGGALSLRPRAPAPPPGVRRGADVTPASMSALMEMGYPPVRCSKALFQCSGNIEQAAMFMLEHGEEPDEFWIFSPDELSWAIETRQAGLEHQLEMLCSRQDLLLAGSGQVQVSLLQLLQSRPVTAAHPWACRAINAFGDRDVLFRGNVRRVLMDCLGVDEVPDSALSSESLDAACVSTLQRIYLDPEFRPGPRDHVLMVDRLLSLVGNFCDAHPRSKLPAACETALEFSKSLCNKSETRNIRDHKQLTVSVVGALCSMVGHEDGSGSARLGALECIAGIVKAQDWSEQGESLLLRLVTCQSGRLAALLLWLLLECPNRIRSVTEDEVYGLTCAILAALCMYSPKVLREMCKAMPVDVATEPAETVPDGMDTEIASAQLEQSEAEAGIHATVTPPGSAGRESALGLELEPEPELAESVARSAQHEDIAVPAPVCAPDDSGLQKLDAIARSGGGLLGCVVLALQQECGDDICALTETLVKLLSDGYGVARAELAQHHGPFYVGDAVQGRDPATSSEYLAGTVLSNNGDGMYDVQWEAGGEPITLPAVHLRRISRGASRGSPRAVADLLGPPKAGIPRAHERAGRALKRHRKNFYRAVLPALLSAHERKSSVHQKFLSVLITTMEKVDARHDTSAESGDSVSGPHAVVLEPLTEDLALLDSRTVEGHATSFGSLVADLSRPKWNGKWYYEVKIGGSSYGQIGFTLNSFNVVAGSGDGVGDDSSSWAYDGLRQKIWHGEFSGGNKEYATHVKWQSGSVVGCLLDLDADEISFSLDGELLGVAFRGMSGQLAGGAYGLCPGATLTAGRHEFRFSDSECEYAPLGYLMFERPLNSFDMMSKPAVVDIEQQNNSATLRPGTALRVATLKGAEPLIPLQIGCEVCASDGYFEVTIKAVASAGTQAELSIGVVTGACTDVGHVGTFTGSFGYLGSDGCVYAQMPNGTPSDDLLRQGDTVGCGIMTQPGSSTVQMFWTKNGRILNAKVDDLPLTEVGHQGWYPAVGLTDSSSQIQTNFGATEYVFDAAEFLQAGSVSFSAFADLAVDEDRSDHEFVPQLMRTTRELLQADNLTSILLALRLITVVLHWDHSSYALLRRQDIVRRVHALACGNMPRSIQGKARPEAVVCHSAAAALGLIEHLAGQMADAQPSEDPLQVFRVLAARIYGGDGDAIRELACAMNTPEGITEFEFEQADFAGAVSHFISSSPHAMQSIRDIFAGDDSSSELLGAASFDKLVRMLQGVLACTDTLPVYHVPSDMRGRGSGLSCLFNPLKVCFTCDPVGLSGPANTSFGGSDLVGMFEPITPIRELEQFVLRHIVCTDSRFENYCRELVGCRIEERADGLDAWKGANVVDFDSSSGRHSLLYENGNGGTPLVRRLLSSRKYRIVRGAVGASHVAAAAEAEFKAKELEAERKQAKKKKSWWARKTSVVQQQLWMPQRGSRVGVKSAQTGLWEPATVISTTDTGLAEVAIDGGTRLETATTERILQLDAPAPGDGPEVQWQWFDGHWWNFSVQESEHLEAARADPSTTGTELQREVRYVIDFKSMTQRDTSTGQERPIRRASSCDLWRELAPEGERAEGDRKELGLLAPLRETDAHSFGAVSQQLALRVSCGFGGFRTTGQAGHLVQREGPWTHVAMGELHSNMTLFQCLMKATDTLDLLSDDGERSSSRALVPWQCSLNITYQIVVEDAVSKCPLDSAGPAAAPGAAPMAPPPAIVPRLGEGSQHDVAAAVGRRWERGLQSPSGDGASSGGAEPVDIVRNIQELGNSPFIHRWGLHGSPNTVAERMGPRLAQAMRDLQGDSFVLNEEEGAMPESQQRVQHQRPISRSAAIHDQHGSTESGSGKCIIGRSFSMLNLSTADISDAERAKEVESALWQQALRTTSPAFQAALKVLAQMHRDEVLRSYAAPSSWRSSKLAYKLRDQLADPLTLVSGALPTWCECLVFGARFLFPLDLRELYFRCTSFGPARAVAWLKQQQPHAFDPVGALKVDRWLIRREDFLEQAYILMSHHARRRTMLQVEFEGPLESGIGSGVHVSFFTDAAALLESWNENRALAAGHGVPICVELSSSLDLIALCAMCVAQDLDVCGPLMCELYPHSLLGASGDDGAVETICRRFSLMGWLFAKALMDQQLDERLLPLRLSPLFVDLVLGRLRLEHSSDDRETITNLDSLPFDQLCATQIKGGTQVQLLLKLWKQLRLGELTGDEIDQTLEDYCVCMVDPATGGTSNEAGQLLEETPLCTNGDAIPVTSGNLGDFFQLLAHSWFGEGVARQVAAFSEAVRQVLPPEKLLAFTTSELLENVCGESVHWDSSTVRECIIPGEGYTGDDPQYHWLLREVESMDAAARKAFLKFVTARVRLPSGGLRALSRKIEIRRSKDVACVPHGHTCALALDLPPYRTRTELHVMLFKALELMNNFDTGLYD